MALHSESPAALDARTGLGLSVCVAAIDSSEPNKSSQIAQSKSRTVTPVEQARRELLRDFVFEAAEGANAYCRAIQNFIAADDSPGLTYAAHRFVDQCPRSGAWVQGASRYWGGRRCVMTSCQYPRGFNEWPPERKNEWFADEARKYREAKKAGKPNGDGARVLAKKFEAASTAAEESLISKRASDVVPESISWLWRDRFPHRRLSVLTGPPGLGKSQITAFLAATVTSGRPWPDGFPCGAKGSVVILSAEDDVADTIVPRLTAAGADHDKVLIVEAVRVEPEGGKAIERGFDLSRDVGQLEKLCASENAALVIIDPISAYFGQKSDSHNNTDVRGLLAPLAALAAKCRAAVVAVTHDRKSGGSAGERTLGSVAFLAAPRAV